jgi:hypothetical protein
VAGAVRLRAIVAGDFTPLKRAEIAFSSCTLPDGTRKEIATSATLGLPTIYVPPRPPKKNAKPFQPQAASPTKAQTVKRQAQQQIQAQISARTRGLYDMVRGQDKREWLLSFFLTKLPYHPQWYRSKTRFDPVLLQPLDFGTVNVDPESFAFLGQSPPMDSTAQMRIAQTVSSLDARVGDPLLGTLTKPMFTADHHLLLPQGTQLAGRVTLTQPAKLWHRGGKLRFAIENVNLPPALEALASHPVDRTNLAPAQLVAAEGDPNTLKVDREGTAKATESKTRLLRPAIAALVAARSMDNDEGKQTASGSGGGNAGGRSLGGFSGFGLLGIAASQGPPQVGAALGFYGLAWSVYTNIVARGGEVVFEKNSELAVRFGATSRRR